MRIYPKRTFIAKAILSAAALAGGAFCHADEWPSRTITMLVPQPPGSIQDLVARSIGDEIARELKQTVVVDNRPSASQIIASGMLAKAQPDGYTLMVAAMPNVIAPNILKGLPYSGNQDFTVIAHNLTFAGLFTIAPQIPANNLKEFIGLLKANPNKYLYGSPGVGTPLHMFLEEFNRQAGTYSVHVPYKSFPPIIPDITTGVVSYSMLPANMLQLAKDGKVKVLGFAGAKRDPQMPDIPTLDEQGLKGFEAGIQYYLIGPKGMAPNLVNRINSIVNTIQSKESYPLRFKALGGFVVPQNESPAQSNADYKRDDERFAPLLKEGRIKFE